MTHKITFVHAPNILYDQNYGVALVPLWAYTLAAHLPDSWHAEVFNTQIDSGLNSKGAADVFAFSGLNKDVDSIRAAHATIKSQHPNSIFIIGGPMVWSLKQEGKIALVDYFDYLFILDGEKTLPEFLDWVADGSQREYPKEIQADRFPISDAKAIDFDLLRPKIKKYYGAMVEVSRGCPFLCEFCDVRVLPGNNRANNKDPAIIVEELDQYAKSGITQVQFVCDNFIGDIKWARECVNAIIEWKERTGSNISIFTWLTINLYKNHELMTKMRLAGFSIFNIGIESVNSNSLLETAKVQNNAVVLEKAVKTINSYGFLIIPGFIFGFDSDTETVFDDTLNFYVDTGLVGGEPAFLYGLAGTPLYKRLERSGRLIKKGNDEAAVRKGNVGIERRIETNVKYLLDSDFLAQGFVSFMKTYLSADYQFSRFKKHMEIIRDYGNYIEPPDSGGYASISDYLKKQALDLENLKMLLARIWYILSRPSIFWAILKGKLLTYKLSKKYAGMGVHFNFWVYVWTNMGMKNSDLKREHIYLESVDKDYNFSDYALAEEGKMTAQSKLYGDEKTEQQARYTNKALESILAKHRAQ